MIPLDWPTPSPDKCILVYDLLCRHRSTLGDSTIPIPKQPLVLAGAAFSTVDTVRGRWVDHLEWANKYGCAAEVLAVLGERPSKDSAFDLAGAHGIPGEKVWWEDLGDEKNG